MASISTSKRSKIAAASSKSLAAGASWYFSMSALVVLLLLSFAEGNNKLQTSRGCEEIYVVGEGETLHTISDKCQDPFIVEQNPQIQDSDVFPGLVIRITASSKSRKLLM